MVHSQNAIDVTHTLWILGLPADDTINSTIRLLVKPFTESGGAPPWRPHCGT